MGYDGEITNVHHGNGGIINNKNLHGNRFCVMNPHPMLTLDEAGLIPL
jgi:hypothetical protein